MYTYIKSSRCLSCNCIWQVHLNKAERENQFLVLLANSDQLINCLTYDVIWLNQIILILTSMEHLQFIGTIKNWPKLWPKNSMWYVTEFSPTLCDVGSVISLTFLMRKQAESFSNLSQITQAVIGRSPGLREPLNYPASLISKSRTFSCDKHCKKCLLFFIQL